MLMKISGELGEKQLGKDNQTKTVRQLVNKTKNQSGEINKAKIITLNPNPVQRI